VQSTQAYLTLVEGVCAGVSQSVRINWVWIAVFRSLVLYDFGQLTRLHAFFLKTCFFLGQVNATAVLADL